MDSPTIQTPNLSSRMRHIQHRASSFILHFPLLVCLFATPALAQTQVTVKLSTGTGFVVNREGYIITNAHVVPGCEKVTITVGGTEIPAEIVVRDTGRDLAALRVAGNATPAIAPMRWNIRDLKVGDPAIVMGYPRGAAMTGQYVFRKTAVTELTGPNNDAAFIQLTHVADHGNSGGPVLDGSGNVIGVIRGYIEWQAKDARGNLTGPVLGQRDIVITLTALANFLDQNRIPRYGAASGQMAYSDTALEANARKFIVPIKCYQGRI